MDRKESGKAGVARARDLLRDGGRIHPGVAATFPVLVVHDGSLTLAWAQRATTAHTHALPATHETKDPGAPMPLPSVGNQQVVVRAGKIVR